MYRIATASPPECWWLLSLRVPRRSSCNASRGLGRRQGRRADRSSGRTTFWVVLRQQANLTPAHSMRPAPRGRLRLRRADCDRGSHPAAARAVARTTPCAVRVLLDPERDPGDGRRHGSPGTRRAPGGREDHPRTSSSRSRPDAQGTRERSPNTVEWGIDRDQRAAGLVDVRRPRRGHRRRQHRHRRPLHPRRARRAVPRQPGGGTFDHNYNWFDPLAVCATRPTPCDNNGHGTHTMGTMVGDDGDPGTNQIGVAPHARWIAAKGCETNSCSTTRAARRRASGSSRRPT